MLARLRCVLKCQQNYISSTILCNNYLSSLNKLFITVYLIHFIFSNYFIHFIIFFCKYYYYIKKSPECILSSKDASYDVLSMRHIKTCFHVFYFKSLKFSVFELSANKNNIMPVASSFFLPSKEIFKTLSIFISTFN